MAAFTKKARFKAIVESIKLYFNACLIPAGVLSNFLVCTKDECKYKLCGITVAPIIPIAMYKAAEFGIDGISPAKTLCTSGSAKIISKMKEKPIIATKAIMKASILRIPLLIRKSSKKVSRTVIKTASSNGIPKRRLIPIAIPRTSARSHAAIATSARKYKM
ncbi:hypothetical protein D3C72_747930 [compost metagenome]